MKDCLTACPFVGPTYNRFRKSTPLVLLGETNSVIAFTKLDAPSSAADEKSQCIRSVLIPSTIEVYRNGSEDCSNTDSRVRMSCENWAFAASGTLACLVLPTTLSRPYLINFSFNNSATAAVFAEMTSFRIQSSSFASSSADNNVLSRVCVSASSIKSAKLFLLFHFGLDEVVSAIRIGLTCRSRRVHLLILACAVAMDKKSAAVNLASSARSLA